MIEEELPGELVDIYSLQTENLLGVILCSQQPNQIIQLIWKLTPSLNVVECIFERKFAFQGVYNCQLGRSLLGVIKVIIKYLIFRCWYH